MLPADIISFDSLLSGGSINLTSGELSITDSLTINGLGANFLTVDAGNQGFRVFNIDDGTANLIDVFINGLTITGGNLFDSSGGGILSRENLTVSNSTISGNTVTAAFDRGGGIFNERGMLTVNNSIISGNTASGGLGFGGGISTFDGTVTITDSTISGNTSGRDGGGISTAFSTVTITNSSISGNTAESGGGIYHSLGTFTLTNSTISDNLASLDGGGISTRDPMTVTNSTISGNTSGRDGGGIDNGDVLAVTNSTISGNTAQNSGGGINNRFDGNITVTNSSISGNTAQSGGGIDNSISFPGNNPIANINNTIIAGNNGTNPDVLGNFNSNGFNLIGNATGSTGFGGTDLIGVDPLLGSLANNGGSTLTLALLPGSPAIDAGSNAAVPPGVTTDQRGAGFDRIVNGTVDIGAFEVQQLPPPVKTPEASSIAALVAMAIVPVICLRKKVVSRTNY
jgi:hypothetical protein